jgi:hypothetical protein
MSDFVISADDISAINEIMLRTMEKPTPLLSNAPVLKPITRVQFKDKPGVVIENFLVRGGIHLQGCPGAIIRNVLVTDAEGHGINLIDCPEAKVEGVASIRNGTGSENKRVGHGLHVNGKSANIEVSSFLSAYNIEDGVQQGNSCVGLVRYRSATLVNNGENGFDGKGGSAVFESSTVIQHTRGEAILLHNGDGSGPGFQGFKAVSSVIDVHDEAPLISLTARDGLAVLRQCILRKRVSTRWFRSGDAVYDAPTEAVAHAVAGKLTVSSCYPLI